MRPPAVPTTIPVDKDDSKQATNMKNLYNSLIDYKEPKTNRSLINVFMSLPARKDFPDYYSVVAKPIAMNKIRERIEKGYYEDDATLLDDFKLMFNNCKFFNEDESQIFKDALKLEEHLEKKYEQLAIGNRPKNHTNGTSKVDNDTSNKITNHDNHNEASMDSNSNLSAELINSTPIEKCSLNTRRGRNSDAPKRQLLTGYIIYASEIRKLVIDKHPNQNFGDISRLVGNEWKALPHDIRSKYDQRALIHNQRVRDKAQKESMNDSSTLGGDTTTNKLPNGHGLHTPKLTKRKQAKLARLAKEQRRHHHLSLTGHDSSSQSSVHINHDLSSPMVTQAPSVTHKHSHIQTQHAPNSINSTTNTSTQTATIRFVEPPPRKRIAYSESFRKYIEGLQVPNTDLLAEEIAQDRDNELPSHWLGSGIGRHESPEAALWALREFMLQDATSMRRSMEPYL